MSNSQTSATTQPRAPEAVQSTQQQTSLNHVSRLARSYVGAGRSFARAHFDLSKGDQASLRREDPLLHGAFWQCVAKAKAALPAEFSVMRVETLEKTLENTLAAMAPLLTLSASRFGSGGQDIGRLLRSTALSDRRIEAILTEKTVDRLVEGLESALSITKGPIDFGVLLGNLMEFQVNAGDARRQWARSLFSSKSLETSAAEA